MSKSNYSEQMTQAEKLYSMHTIHKIPEMCYELSGNILSLILKKENKALKVLCFLFFYMRDSFGNCIHSSYAKCMIIHM